MSMGPNQWQQGYDAAMNAMVAGQQSLREEQNVRDLKQRWLNLLAAKPNGVGLTRHGSGWALKINTALALPGDVPTQLDGVPVIVEFVGTVTAAG